MAWEIRDKKLGIWLKPEEAIEALEKRRAEGGLTFDEEGQLKSLKKTLEERAKQDIKIAEQRKRNEQRIRIAESPEAVAWKKKADALREDEKRKHPGGHYL
ncbi:MAG: hypothetical protein Q7R73_00785 [bacterium]|nr:hypothetical protein [bacterium]